MMTNYDLVELLASLIKTLEGLHSAIPTHGISDW